MQLGFVTAILPELEFEEVLRVGRDIGYDCVEVMCWPEGKAKRRYAGVTHIDVNNLEVEQVHDLCAKYGIRISALGYYPNPLSGEEEEAEIAQEHIRKVIMAAQALGLETANTFVGRNHKLSIEDNWPVFLEVWRPVIRLAEKCNVRIGIENCPMSFGEDEWPGGKNLMISPSIWQRAYEDIPSNHFGLNFDPSHFVWQLIEVRPALTRFADKLFHLHAKDATLDKERLNDVGVLAHPKEFHTPKIPGLGHVDWPELFDVLREIGYDGPICVEVEDRDFEDSLEGRIEALRQSHDYLRKFIPHC